MWNAKEITGERDLDVSPRPWGCLFLFSRLREKWRSMSNILRRCSLHLFPSRFTWSRSRMGEWLRCGCPVSGPRRPREETRPEPIGSQTYRNGSSSAEDCVWSSWPAVSQLGRSYKSSSSVRTSGILARVGRSSCSPPSSSPPRSPHLPFHLFISLSRRGFFPFLPRPVYLRLLLERRCSISWWSVMRITRLSRWCARWVSYRWYMTVVMIFVM